MWQIEVYLQTLLRPTRRSHLGVEETIELEVTKSKDPRALIRSSLDVSVTPMVEIDGRLTPSGTL